MGKQVAGKSRSVYYVGLGIMVAGGLLFLAVLVAATMHFGDFRSLATRGGIEVVGALCGMMLMMVGIIVSRMGSE